MRVETYVFQNNWDKPFNTSLDSKQTLILLFGNIDTPFLLLALAMLNKNFPHSKIIGTSSVGNIVNDTIVYNALHVAIIHFEYTFIKHSFVTCDEYTNAYDAGVSLTAPLVNNALKHLFILSSGMEINGTDLTDGIKNTLPPHVFSTGGVASAVNKKDTWVLSDNKVDSNKVVAIAFYGSHIRIGYGSYSGLEKLGLTRKVTYAKGREILLLDGKPALTLYKKYLGKYAQELSKDKLLFPIALLDEKGKIIKIRSVIDINESNNSLILNDTVSQNMSISLMTANFNRLIDGACQAGIDAWDDQNPIQPEKYFIIPISCTGRKKIMSQRIEEELFAMKEGLPVSSHILGFYADGEIAPLAGHACTLQNHTISLTSISEVHHA